MIDQLLLSPRPKTIIEQSGGFRLDAATCIALDENEPEASRTGGESLRDAIRDRFELALAVETSPTLPVNTITLSIVPCAPAQGYQLSIETDRVSILGNDAAGLFYGVQTLIQIAASCGRVWPALTIEDWPSVANRGYLLDITRGKVHSIETLETFIRTAAHFKANHLQLYTEDVFDFPSAPEIGAENGALTPVEVRRLDALCRELHIELAPNFQSLGHQGRLLKIPAYQHLAETPWQFTFATDNDEVFQFLDLLYGDLLPCFSSRLFNVNADEPWDMGRGVSRSMAAERGIGGLYLHHLRRLHELATKHGCRMAMWADVLKHHPDLISQLPEDVLLIDWWYEASDAYDSLDALAASGREFWVCAATSSWIALYPRLNNALGNIHDYVEQGVARGATGVLISDWGDSGHDQPFSNSRYPLLWGAECAWTGATTPLDAFDAAYGLHVLRDRSGALIGAMRRLGATMQVERNWLAGWNSAMALYEDPLVGKVAKVSPAEVVADAAAAGLALQPLLSQIPDPIMRADLGFAITQLGFACEKVERTRSLQAIFAGGAASASDIAEQLDRFIAEMQSQRDRLPAMIAEFEQRWLVSARRSSIQFNLDRFHRLLLQFDHALGWLRGQATAVRAGQPLAALASYDPKGYAVLHEATYYWIKELEAIIGFDELPEDIKIYLRDAGIE